MKVKEDFAKQIETLVSRLIRILINSDRYEVYRLRKRKFRAAARRLIESRYARGFAELESLWNRLKFVLL